MSKKQLLYLFLLIFSISSASLSLQAMEQPQEQKSAEGEQKIAEQPTKNKKKKKKKKQKKADVTHKYDTINVENFLSDLDKLIQSDSAPVKAQKLQALAHLLLLQIDIIDSLNSLVINLKHVANQRITLKHSPTVPVNYKEQMKLYEQAVQSIDKQDQVSSFSNDTSNNTSFSTHMFFVLGIYHKIINRKPLSHNINALIKNMAASPDIVFLIVLHMFYKIQWGIIVQISSINCFNSYEYLDLLQDCFTTVTKETLNYSVHKRPGLSFDANIVQKLVSLPAGQYSLELEHYNQLQNIQTNFTQSYNITQYILAIENMLPQLEQYKDNLIVHLPHYQQLYNQIRTRLTHLQESQPKKQKFATYFKELPLQKATITYFTATHLKSTDLVTDSTHAIFDINAHHAILPNEKEFIQRYPLIAQATSKTDKKERTSQKIAPKETPLQTIEEDMTHLSISDDKLSKEHLDPKEKIVDTITYADRILKWDNAEFVNTQPFKNIFYHRFAKLVDACLLREGIVTNYKGNPCYQLPGKVTFGDGEERHVIFHITFNKKGECFHRGLQPTTLKDIIDEFTETSCWKVLQAEEFPSLGNIKHTLQTSNIGECVTEENNLKITIQDPQFDAVYTLYKARQMM